MALLQNDLCQDKLSMDADEAFAMMEHDLSMESPAEFQKSDSRTYRECRESKSEVPEDIRLRINHRERQRMHDLNSALDSLRSVMPFSQGPSVKKLSKMSTLLMARNYIVMLNRSLDEMKQKVQELSATQHVVPPPAPLATSAPLITGLPTVIQTPTPKKEHSAVYSSIHASRYSPYKVPAFVPYMDPLSASSPISHPGSNLYFSGSGNAPLSDATNTHRRTRTSSAPLKHSVSSLLADKPKMCKPKLHVRTDSTESYLMCSPVPYALPGYYKQDWKPVL